MSAQQQMFEKYGTPINNYHLHCIMWEIEKDFPWFPAPHFLVNADFKKLLFNAFTALQAAGLHTEIKTFDGCYNDRTVRGSTATSLHAWAAAIDMNAAEDGMIVNPTPEQRKGTWSDAFISAMKTAGIFYGGDFIHRSDAMHFALLDG